MADITFNQEMQGYLNSFEIDLQDEAISILNNTKISTNNNVIDAVRDNTRSFREYLAVNIKDANIEHITGDFFEEIKRIHLKQIQENANSLKQITESIIRLIHKKDIDGLESSFITLTNELIRKQNASIFTDSNQQCANEIESYVKSCFMYTPRIGNAMYDVKNNTRRILTNYCERLMDEYKTSLVPYLKRYREQVLEVIKSQLKDKAKEEQRREEEKAAEERRNQEIRREQEKKTNGSILSNEMQFIAPNLKKFGVIVEETFDGFTVKTANSEKSMPLSKDSNGIYSSEDHSIEFQDFGSEGIVVTLGNNVIRETKDSCYFGTRENPYQTQLTIDFLDYKVRYNDIEQTDLIKKGVILDNLARTFPDYYNHLSREPLFASLKNEIEAAKKNNEDLYLDESLIVHINPNNRESFIDKMSVLDLSVDERPDGVYVIEPGGLEHHLLYSSGYAYFEDNPKMGFNTNFYSLTEKGVIGPQIDLHVGNTTLTISNDYHFITLSGNNQIFRLGYDSLNQFVCEVIINNKVIRNNETLKETLKKACPKAYERVKEICIAYEQMITKGAEPNAEVHEAMTPTSANNSSEIIQEPAQAKVETNELLEELEGGEQLGEQVEKIHIGEQNIGEQVDIRIVEDTSMSIESIEDEIFLLEQDPNVQRYIELMKLQEEQNAMNQDPAMYI